MSSRGKPSRTMERVERMMKIQEEKELAERKALAAKNRGSVPTASGKTDHTRIRAETKSVAQAHLRSSPESPSRVNSSAASIPVARNPPQPRSSPRGMERSSPTATMRSNESSPSSPYDSRFSSSPTHKFNSLAKAIDAELEQQPSPGRFRSPGRPDPEFFQPLSDADTYDLSPSTGEKVLNEWDRVWGTPPDEIMPGFMWLAQERGCLFMDRLPFESFTHCVFATNKATSPYPSEKYLCIQLSDDPDTDLRARFEESNAFIEDAKRTPNAKVLVHCRMGQSRSTTLVIAWVMSHYMCSMKEALLWVKARRDIICPNTGFFVQLQKYERELFGCCSPSMSISAGRKAGCCSVSKLNGM